MTRIKQVIVIRRDLTMRRGKEIAQGSHAAMDFLVSAMRTQLNISNDVIQLQLSDVEKKWITVGMAKICLQAHSEEELLDIHKKSLAAGLKSHLIQDSGRTEFAGVPTYTACAIGPDSSDRIDPITGTLKLY